MDANFSLKIYTEINGVINDKRDQLAITTDESKAFLELTIGEVKFSVKSSDIIEIAEFLKA